MRICLLTDEVIGDFNPSGYLKNYDLDYLTVSPPAVEFLLLRCRMSIAMMFI